ncbi:prolyl endopeptidase FAP [Hyperolius riggenbachi]|uniref:prolyl endopeptidase FAP n=1 Tax=Hyperolius riggenbachi TaxID=752182 RepID=UPI0035A2692C
MRTPSKVVIAAGAAVVLILLVVMIVLLKPGNSNSAGRRTDGLQAFTFDDVFNTSFNTQQYVHLWLSENEYMHKNEDGNVHIYNVETGEATLILRNTTSDEVNATNYKVSADRRFASLESNYVKRWKNSYTASYHIYDIANREFLTANELPHGIQYLSWSPVGHKLVYVWKNNIYLRHEPSQASVALTNDGKQDEILNGVPDWVYEELVIATNYALWWSPGAKFLGYVQFNDKDVPSIEYTYYGEDQYPKTMKVPYPKAGAHNPTVKVYTVNLDDPGYTKTEVPVPSLISSSGDYIFHWMSWILDDRVCVQWMTRLQNVAVVSICDYDHSSYGWNCPKDRQHVETSKTGWIGTFFPDMPTFTSDGLSYYQIRSDKNGYKHIHYIQNSVENAIPITSGEWEVLYITLVTDNALYYTSNEHEGVPGNRNVYRISLQGPIREKKCLSCTLRKDMCQYNYARFSTNAKYYTLYCYGPGLPLTTIFDGSTSREIKVLEDNSRLGKRLQAIRMPESRIGNFNIDGIIFWYKMILPPYFDKSKKYPLLIYVYGGPCSQDVTTSFKVSWSTYLASSEDIIVATVDGRGTAYRGDKFMHALYKRLGTLEVEDQISGVRKFIEMGFIDETRIAIWGWSYGGYVTSMVLGHGSGLFKCGIAVAPVSSWEYYASFYSEKYMGLPTSTDNLEHYKNSSVMSRIENFKKVDFLLIHGTADDNVHFQQAAQLSKALVEAQVEFEAMWYTDKDHSISGAGRRHLYTHMTHFLKRCFSLS